MMGRGEGALGFISEAGEGKDRHERSRAGGTRMGTTKLWIPQAEVMPQGVRCLLCGISNPFLF